MTPLSQSELLSQLDALPGDLESLTIRSSRSRGGGPAWPTEATSHVDLEVAPGVELNFEAARRLPSVSMLRIDAVRIPDGLLTLIFEQAPEIQSLSMRQTNLGETGAEQLATLLQPSTLERLDLHDNELPAQAAYNLVVNQPRLSHLDLSWNTLTDGGVVPLVEFMEGANIPIQVLDLTKTRVDERGASAIAGANLPDLRDLRLARNNIGDPGAQTFADSSLNLQYLDLSKNWFHGKAARSIQSRFATAEVHVGVPDNQAMALAPHLVVFAIVWAVLVYLVDADVWVSLAIAVGVLILTLGAQNAIQRSTLAAKLTGSGSS